MSTSTPEPAPAAKSNGVVPATGAGHHRSELVDAIRAIAATAIVWHHLARYWPAADSRSSALYEVIRWLDAYAPWAATVFFVLGGYVIASSTSHRVWDGRQLVRFAAHRYLRLGLPYLAAIAATMAACAYGRGWLADDVIGAPPTVPQVLAHVVFLQDILGYESLSAGLWFVCIIFQLDMLYAAMLWVGHWFGPRTSNQVDGDKSQTWLPLALGWLLAIAALFYFNRHNRFEPWAIYYFGQFFLGVLASLALRKPKLGWQFWIYCAVMAAALAYSWRARLFVALATAVVLYLGGKLDFMDRRRHAVIDSFGRTSYSLFLIHFAVLVLVATVWVRNGWGVRYDAIGGMAAAYVLSLVAAVVFYRAVELPAARLSKRFA